MRKAAAVSFSFSFAVFISHYIAKYEYLLIYAAVSMLIFFTGYIFSGNARKRIFIISLSLGAGFLWCFAYNEIYLKPYTELDGQNAGIYAVVTDYSVARQPRGYRADVSIINKNKPDTAARIYYYNEQTLTPGDIITAAGRIYRADINSDGERYDTLTSRGIYITMSVSGDIEIIGTDTGVRFMPAKFAQSMADKIDEIFPGDTSAFMKAFLIGRRDDLYNDKAVYNTLTASGISHIISVSGMHISFLMGFLAVVIRNKRLFAFYGIPVLLLFMAMTGFSPAVSRAGFMQILLICAPVFKRESDSITSLSLALFILLALNPYACASAGLQMSFAATFGIILFTPRISFAVSDFLRDKKINRKKVPRAVIHYIYSTLAATIGALIFTLPLSVIHFGYISLVAPLTNLLVIGVVSFMFPLGMLATALSFVNISIGSTAAVPVVFGIRYVTLIAGKFASVPYGISYSSNVHIMLWLGYVYIMFSVLPVFKARLRQYLYPVCISIIMLFSVILISVLLQDKPAGQDWVTVLDVGQGQSVIAGIEENIIVFDCGSISTNKAGEIAHEYLQNIGCTSIDILAVTHFHDDHINGVQFLLSAINVSALIIPDPAGSYLAEDIISLARRKGTDIIYVTQTMSLTFDESIIYIYPPLASITGSGSDENERGLSFLISGSINALITGDMNSAFERTLLRFAHLPKLDMLIAGHHGSKESTSPELLETLMPDIAVISVGKNSFGHPHPDTLSRLSEHTATIYRTDELGHINITGRQRKAG